jgi:hypothetical protein
MMRMLKDYEIDDIKLIKTDCLGFDKVVEYDENVFKVEEFKESK